ncbi:MAG: RING finger protein [Planctomycetota bacterium]|jgi:hypothetical protein
MIRKGIIVILSLLTMATGVGLFLNSTLGGGKCVRYSWITPDDWYNQVQVQNWSLLIAGQPRSSLQVVMQLPVGWRVYRGSWYLRWWPGWGVSTSSPSGSWHIRFPLVFLIPFFAAYPALVVYRGARRRRRRKRGLCKSCKYDLTGNESGVCPECGTPIKDAV